MAKQRAVSKKRVDNPVSGGNAIESVPVENEVVSAPEVEAAVFRPSVEEPVVIKKEVVKDMPEKTFAEKEAELLAALEALKKEKSNSSSEQKSNKSISEMIAEQRSNRIYRDPLEAKIAQMIRKKARYNRPGSSRSNPLVVGKGGK